MLMLIDTPDPRYRPESGRDGPGRPRLGPWTGVLLTVCAACVYFARHGAPLIQFLLLVTSFAAFLAAVLSLWMHGDATRDEEP